MRYICILCLLASWPTCGQTMASFEWPGDLNAIPTANATAIGTIQTLVNGALAPAGIIARVGLSLRPA